MTSELTLADVCSELVDCVNRTAPETSNGPYFAVGTPAMRGNVIDLSQSRRISAETFSKWTRRLVPQENDILLAREAPVGPVVRIPSGGKIAAGQRTMHFRANSEIVHPRYLFYLLISTEVQAHLLAMAMGSTVPHLRVADVKAFTLPVLPSVAYQDAVQQVLGALDDKIAANDRIIARVKELLSAELTCLQQGGGPTLVSVSELVEFNPKTRKPNVDEPVYLDMKNLPDQAMTVTSWNHRAPRGGARFQNGDTLLARITPCLENGKTGYVDFLAEGETGIGSTEFIVMRAREGIPSALSYFLAIDKRFREFAIKHMVGTSGRQRLAARDIADFQIRQPKKAEMDRFGTLSGTLMRRVKAAVDESRVLANTRDELLPLLMSGKIRVRNAEKIVEEVV